MQVYVLPKICDLGINVHNVIPCAVLQLCNNNFTTFVFLSSFVDVFFLSSLQNGLNALHLAAKEGHKDLVEELLERGANVDSSTKVHTY